MFLYIYIYMLVGHEDSGISHCGFSLNERCMIKYELETLCCVGMQQKILGS